MLNTNPLRRLLRRSALQQPTRSRRTARAAAAASVVEPLEGRTLHAADAGGTFDTAYLVGDLDGHRAFLESVGAAGDSTDMFKFSMPRAGRFVGNLRTHTGNLDLTLLREVVNPDGSTQVVFVESRTATRTGADGGHSSGELAARLLQPGTYFLAVQPLTGFETPYDLTFHADYAGDTMQTARDLGVAQHQVVRDYLADYANPLPTFNDLEDWYKFRMEAKGTIGVGLNLDDRRPSNEFKFQLIHDVNNSGTVDPGELVIQLRAVPDARLSKSGMPAGTYFVRAMTEPGASNYRLTVSADYAGSSGPTGRDFGSLGVTKSFNDFLEVGHDPVDLYHFTAPAKRTLALSSFQDDTGSSRLWLYKDVNGNREAEPSELLASTQAATFNRILRTVDAGGYIVVVEGVTGSGKYTVAAEMRPDGAGNTLGTAKNLGAVSGLNRQNDFISASDAVDFYKFTASAAGTVSALLHPELGNADLALVRDANNNGRVDANEVLAASTLSGTQPDKLSRSIAAGNYFLRVTHGGGTDAKYQLIFHTDYAGATPATARAVGTLAGARTFDDWASGNFGGVISDTQDLYKFNLTATKTFSAKLTGSFKGQDLVLQVYRDKNGNGVLEGTELVAASDRPNSPDEQIIKSLTAGTYFVRVVGLNGETNYRLALQA